ncbi:MAG: hypothetical protein HC875_02575 [Anaerolineales bacterium]|nr:hypothetical protein [Anaerolineales bacterium]
MFFYARDELAIWPWSDQFSVAVWAGDPAGTLTESNYPGIPMFWAQTLFLTFKYSFPSLFPQTNLPPELLSQDRNIELLAERRLTAGLLVSLQVIYAVWLIRRLWGWPSALLGAILLGLDPFSLSEARVLRLEMTSDLFVCLSILAYLLYLRCRHSKALLLSGIMAGLGLSAKVSAGLMVPYIWLLLALDFLFGPGQSWLQKFRQLIRAGLIWGGAALITFWVIWPAMWVKPVEALQHLLLTGISKAAELTVWGDKVFFWGQVIDGGDPGPFFYPVVLAFRTTPLMWVGLAGVLIFLVITLWRKSAVASMLRWPGDSGAEANSSLAERLWGWPWPVISIALLLLYIGVALVELNLVISKVDRFLLLIFPVLDVVSALGLIVLLNWLTSRFKVHSSWAAPSAVTTGFIFLVLILQLVITLPAHPYFFTYWNPWAGGGQAAMELLPIGAGEGIDLAMNFLNEQPGAAAKTVVCGGSRPWCSRIFKGKTVRSADYVDGRWVQADYATFYISQLQRQLDPPEVVNFFKQQTPLYRVNLQGVNYVWVYAVPDIAHFAGRSNDLAGLGRLLGYNFSGSASSPGGEVTAKPGESIEIKVWWTNFGAGIDNLVVRWVDKTGYEWGRAGIIPRPEYAAIAPNERAIVTGTAALTIPFGTPPGLYFWRIGVRAPEEGRLLGEFNLPDNADTLVITPGQILTESTKLGLTHTLNHHLASEVRLLGYDPPIQVLNAVAPTWLTLYWQASTSSPNYQVVLRLIDNSGQELTHWQGQPGYGQYPTETWRTGEIVKDVWALQVPADTPVGNYNLEISLFNPDLPYTSSSPVLIPQFEVLPQPVNYTMPKMQAELQRNFGNRLTLLGYDLYFNAGGAEGDILAPVFYWRSLADFEAAFDLLLTLRAADTDQMIKEWRLPLGTAEAKTFWKAGEVVNTDYQLDLSGLINGRYHLDLALQDSTRNQVEPVKQDDGSEKPVFRIENIQEKIVVRIERP